MRIQAFRAAALVARQRGVATLVPMRDVADWFEDAKKKEPSDPNAMALATADASGARGEPPGGEKSRSNSRQA